jgi:phosphoglycerate dehydrogenase-like enzyme
MNVVVWSPNMTEARAQEAGASFKKLDELLATADIVSLHIVAGPTTKGLLSAEKIALMKPSALLVNTSRSTLVDTNALVQALQNRKIQGAAIDVFDEEPLAHNHPLRSTPNTLLTPHLGFVARPVFESFATGVVECLEAWLDGQPIVRPLP